METDKTLVYIGLDRYENRGGVKSRERRLSSGIRTLLETVLSLITVIRLS